MQLIEPGDGIDVSGKVMVLTVAGDDEIVTGIDDENDYNRW